MCVGVDVCAHMHACACAHAREGGKRREREDSDTGNLVQDSKFSTKTSIILLHKNLESRYIEFILLFLIDGPLGYFLFSSLQTSLL